MKIDRLIWGILLLFIGGVLLLKNFGFIDFYWSNVWHFWPIFLIIAGINILFKRSNAKTGNIISLAILIITLAFLFYRGQQRPSNGFWWGKWNHQDIDVHIDDDDREEADTSRRKFSLSEPFIATDTIKKTVLNISGGGISFKLDGAADDLIRADVHKRHGDFSLTKQVTDSTTELAFTMRDKKNKWNFGDEGNQVDFKLNKAPNWEVVMKLGAGEADFDFEHYKIRNFRFDGGAAALDIKFGSLLPIADVNIKSGVADVKIKIPESSGCRITAKTGLSAKNFEGFNKISDGVYETSNYKQSAKKIFINLDGGLSNFEVNRY